MKRFLGWVVGATLLAQMGYADTVDRLAQTLTDALAGQGTTKVAVLPFRYHDGKTSSGSSIVQERLTTALAQTQRVEVIERALLDRLLSEKKLEVEGVLDSKTTTEIGKVLGVNAIVSGTLIELPNRRTEINARAIDTTSGKILSAAKSEIETAWSDSPVARTAVVWNPDPRPTRRPLMQVALLLDTSSSMDGLIVQAKQQLWKIANQLASAERRGVSPIIQIALYEYGNDRLSAEGNYIRQVLPFTSDLDVVSEKLFSLTTNGGQEYCGAVIQNATRDLAWSPDPDTYKAIFIAGNEPFTQGPVAFQSSMADARRKGIVVNTIFCGARQEGLATGWSEGAQLARGEFWSIDHDAAVVATRTPYDDEIQQLGMSLSQTYVAMGGKGVAAKARQETQDQLAVAAAPAGAAVERSVFKASKQYANAPAWDAVSSLSGASGPKLAEARKDLPMELKEKSDEELRGYFDKQASRRKDIQTKIQQLNTKRQAYLASQVRTAAPLSLDQAMAQAVKVQAQKAGFKMK